MKHNTINQTSSPLTKYRNVIEKKERYNSQNPDGDKGRKIPDRMRCLDHVIIPRDVFLRHEMHTMCSFPDGHAHRVVTRG